jgi:hypothetical protein
MIGCAKMTEEPRTKVLKFLQDHEGELLRIKDIATATDLAWSAVIRELTYLLFDYLTRKHPELLDELPIRPEKKWSDWLITPQAVQEVA